MYDIGVDAPRRGLERFALGRPIRNDSWEEGQLRRGPVDIDLTSLLKAGHDRRSNDRHACSPVGDKRIRQTETRRFHTTPDPAVVLGIGGHNAHVQVRLPRIRARQGHRSGFRHRHSNGSGGCRTVRMRGGDTQVVHRCYVRSGLGGEVRARTRPDPNQASNAANVFLPKCHRRIGPTSVTTYLQIPGQPRCAFDTPISHDRTNQRARLYR